MQSLVSVLAYASLASAVAVPAVSPRNAGQFTVNVKYNENFKGAAVHHGATRRDDGDTTAHNSKARPDAEYYAEMSIGTPGQKLNLLFDTGSSDLWAFGVDAEGSIDEDQDRWNASASTTAELVEDGSWDIHYGDGSGASGEIYTDVVSVAGIKVSDQGVEVATEVSAQSSGGDILGKPVSGIVGFGFDSGNTASPKQKTLFTNMKGSLDEPVFTVDLKHKTDGTFGFGFIDDTKYTGDINYRDVDTDGGYWTWTSTGYAVDDGDFVEVDMTGIADTGGSGFEVPSKAYKAYTDAIEDYDGDFDCDKTLPDFYFGVGNNATIKVDGTVLRRENDDGTCRLKITDGGSSAFFGSPAMTGAFVVFEHDDDKDTPRIGWATAK